MSCKLPVPSSGSWNSVLEGKKYTCVLCIENRRQIFTEYGMALKTLTGLAERYIISLKTEFHASVSYIGVHK
jgi:hypothetical protein